MDFIIFIQNLNLEYKFKIKNSKKELINVFC